MCLTVGRGANGLNLTEANHVLLLEPSINPAAEAQAIGRVFRIGQEKEMFIHRFIVRNTVEERVLKMAEGRASAATAATLVAGWGARTREDDILDLDDLGKLINDPQKAQRALFRIILWVLSGIDEKNTSDVLDPASLAYWREDILYNGRKMPRFSALAVISRLARLDAGELDSETVELHGRRMSAVVADAIRVLPFARS